MPSVRRAISSFAFAILVLLGCDGAAPPIDAGRDAGRDAATVVDAGRADGGALDAGVLDGGVLDGGSFVDASLDGGLEPDAGTLDAGSGPQVGTITGTCGVLDDELTSAAPYFFDNVMTFDDGWSRDRSLLSEGAQEILLDGTAGGSSGYSEAFAFEVLHRCEGASLVKTETEILYDTTGALTDILVAIDGMRIGVSVTRAVTVTARCTRGDTFAEAEAERVLTEKLSGINESTRNVSVGDRWVKQILFVFADTMAHLEVLRTVWARLDATLRADTILYVSVSEAMDGFIYFEDRCGA